MFVLTSISIGSRSASSKQVQMHLMFVWDNAEH